MYLLIQIVCHLFTILYRNHIKYQNEYDMKYNMLLFVFISYII